MIVGLKMARKLNIRSLRARSDSQIVVQQVNGEYEAKEKSLKKYLELVRTITESFESFTLEQIPREENTKADALSKLASSEVQVEPGHALFRETLSRKSHDREVRPVAQVTLAPDSWIAPIRDYLMEAKVPTDRGEARKV